MNSNRKIKEFLICLLLAIVVLLTPERDTKADFVFGEPENLGPHINTAVWEVRPLLSADDLTLVFTRENEAGLLSATRLTKSDPWSMPENVGWFPIVPDVVPGCTTADGLEVYFWSEIIPGYGRLDLFVCTREAIGEEWGDSENLGPVVNSAGDEMGSYISADGLELYFSGYSSEGARPGGYGHSDLWVTRRATRNDPWMEPENLGPIVNSAYQDARPSLSQDGLVLLFDSLRPSGYGSGDLYMCKRTTVSSPWGKPINLGPNVNSSTWEYFARLSSDDSILYFCSQRSGGFGKEDIWQSSIEPVVDFSGDGYINNDDLLIIIDKWWTDESVCDIGPMPWGDGVVDIEDLKVFIEYWEQEDMQEITEEVE